MSAGLEHLLEVCLFTGRSSSEKIVLEKRHEKCGKLSVQEGHWIKGILNKVSDFIFVLFELLINM